MELPGGLPGVPLPPAGARLPDAAPPVDTDQPMDDEQHQAALEEKGPWRGAVLAQTATRVASAVVVA